MSRSDNTKEVHFGAHCLAHNKRAAVALSAEQAEQYERDPMALLFSLPSEQRQEIIAFWREHEACGRDLVPCVVMPP